MSEQVKVTEKTKPVPAPKTVRELQAEFDAVAREASVFDKGTVQLVKQLDEQRKAALKRRQAERDALMARKVAAFRALDVAKRAAGVK